MSQSSPMLIESSPEFWAAGFHLYLHLHLYLYIYIHVYISTSISISPLKEPFGWNRARLWTIASLAASGLMFFAGALGWACGSVLASGDVRICQEGADKVGIHKEKTYIYIYICISTHICICICLYRCILYIFFLYVHIYSCGPCDGELVGSGIVNSDNMGLRLSAGGLQPNCGLGNFRF